MKSKNGKAFLRPFCVTREMNCGELPGMDVCVTPATLQRSLFPTEAGEQRSIQTLDILPEKKNDLKDILGKESEVGIL